MFNVVIQKHYGFRGKKSGRVRVKNYILKCFNFVFFEEHVLRSFISGGELYKYMTRVAAEAQLSPFINKAKASQLLETERGGTIFTFVTFTCLQIIRTKKKRFLGKQQNPKN